jgi:two-component system nitrogen regulation response regulator GlnG
MIPALAADPAPDAGATILVVDDDAAVRDVVSEALRDAGYRVRQASDGLAALAALETAGVALVLSDVQMPRLGGLALAQLLLARLHPVPVVLMSAVAPRARPETVPYVPKPFVLEQLLRVVADALARSGSRQEAGRQGAVARPRAGG